MRRRELIVFLGSAATAWPLVPGVTMVVGIVARPMIAALAIGFCLVGLPARAQQDVLEKFVGRWDVRVKTLQPQKPDVTYIETYEWVLGRQFIRARTEQKSDGTEDIIIGGYDAQTKTYPFWVFSSTGTTMFLPSGTWDARGRIMEWKNPPQSDVSYRGRCVLPDESTRRCTLAIKDWVGRVLLEQESSAVRRND
jgi:Protein of unknown function (DUF1579)